MSGCTIDELGRRVADAAAERAVVLVRVPGSAAERAVDVVTSAMRAGAPGDASDIVRMARTDRARSGSLALRRRHVETARVVVIADVQWADDESLTELTELASACADGVLTIDSGEPVRLVLLERVGLRRQRLGELNMALRRRATTVEVAPYDQSAVEALLVGDGVTAADLVDVLGPHAPADPADLTASWLVDRAGGSVDLIDALVAGELLDTEVVARLAVLDTDERSVAEALAFGADLATIGGFADVVGGSEALDAALDTLTVEGLAIGSGMPLLVAAATRRSCTPARRHTIVQQLVEFGPAGLQGDIAAALLDVGDRTELAAGFYLRHATSLVATDTGLAATFAAAAAEAGADGTALASIAAMASLAEGDAISALRHLHELNGAEVELVRATAWAALGDLGAAAGALQRSTAPLLAHWAAFGAGAPLDAELPGGRRLSDLDVDVDGAGASLVRALDSWLRQPVGDAAAHAALFDDLRRATVEFRVDPDAAQWPVSPDAVAVLIAARLGAADVATRTALAALNERPGGDVHRARHRLLAAWLDARRGLLDAAAEVAAEFDGVVLAPYDRFLLAAVNCAVAVRDQHATDVDATVDAAVAAADALGPNLYTLDALTDVAAAAERCRSGASGALFAVAARAVDGVGPSERAQLDFLIARLRAAMAADDLDTVAERAAAVASAAAGIDIEPAASGAAPLLVAMLNTAALLEAVHRDAAVVDVAVVVDAASRLAAAGAPHEAARLCGLVANATSDAGAARLLLKQSRDWRAARAALKRTAGADHAVIKLSEQELRVGQMVADGHTYKQIGAVLFISPKTVEHHVAHIRTKLGASSRAEMLAALRDYFDTGTRSA